MAKSQPRSAFCARIPVVSSLWLDKEYVVTVVASVRGRRTTSHLSMASDDSSSSTPPSTTQAPLYDGTNYTFPDTTQVVGIAQVLEVSFVHACYQLSTGLVDILKMFVAAAIAGYEQGFALSQIEEALLHSEACLEQNTANRDLSPDELELRQSWYSLVYLTLSQLDHPTVSTTYESLLDSCGPTSYGVINDLKEIYGPVMERVTSAYQPHLSAAPEASNHEETPGPIIGLTLERLVQDHLSDHNMSPMVKAIRSQNIRVITMIPIVLDDTASATVDGAAATTTNKIMPPTPPIKGAFE